MVATAAQEHAHSVAGDGSKVPEAQVVGAAVVGIAVLAVLEVLAVQAVEEAVARGPPHLEKVRAGFAEILLLLGQALQGSA